MANTIEYADSPNETTAFVVQEGGQKNRVVLTAQQDTSTLELPDNPNSTKGYVTVDGKKHKVVLTADIGGGVTSLNGETGDVELKTINGNGLVGSGNLELSTFLSYPAGWTTNSTTKAFCDGIAADTTATVGKAYLGEVTCSDLPASMVNAEVVVEIMDGTTAQNKVIVLSLKSGNVAPYAWQYTYWNGGSNVSGWQTWQEPLVSGTNIKTINGTSLLGSGDITTEAIQVSTMPTASANELGNVYQFVGTTDVNYTHGYFYECVSDGQNPATYSWSAVQVQASSGGLPSQTGQNGKFLTTDGTDASWATVNALQNNTTANYALAILGHAYDTHTVSVGANASALKAYTTAVGMTAKAYSLYMVSIGYNAGTFVENASYAIAIGSSAQIGSGATHAIQLGTTGSTTTNSDANTFKVANANGNFEIMDANGNLPADRLASITGLADGNYRPRLTISSGVATITWVAE